MSRIVALPLIVGLAAGLVALVVFVLLDATEFWTVVAAGIVVAAVTGVVYAKGVPGSVESPREAAERFATEGDDDKPSTSAPAI
jgi:hypothetical protein